VFISSLFTGMSVLVARFTGRNEPDKVDRTIYQAFLTAIGLSLGVMAPLGYVLAPALLDFVNAAPDVQAEALPYLRIMFVFSAGTLVFFMLGGALRCRQAAAAAAQNDEIEFLHCHSWFSARFSRAFLRSSAPHHDRDRI